MNKDGCLLPLRPAEGALKLARCHYDTKSAKKNVLEGHKGDGVFKELVRVGAVGAVVAAAGYVAMFAVEMTMAEGLERPLPNVPLVVGLAGTLLAILDLHALHRGSYGRLGVVGF